jgi:glutaconate CoA-transferase subunit B
MEKNYSINELMACVIARDVEDGDSLQCGANALIQRAGILLGHLHHGPNCRILIGRTYANLYEVPVLQLYDSNTDWRAARWGEYIIPHDESFSFNGGRQIDMFVPGALQVDRFGNSNMIGIGPDVKHLKVRGPGGVGTTPVGAFLGRYNILLNHHDKRTLVEKCDFISGVGFGDGPDFRKRYFLPGGGPRYVITPMCVFDFEETTKRMRLKSVHPGVDVDKVLAATGFEPLVPAKVAHTPEPTAEELDILRRRIDPKGVMRQAA